MRSINFRALRSSRHRGYFGLVSMLGVVSHISDLAARSPILAETILAGRAHLGSGVTSLPKAVCHTQAREPSGGKTATSTEGYR
jgi:hypothetical protein